MGNRVEAHLQYGTIPQNYLAKPSAARGGPERYAPVLSERRALPVRRARIDPRVYQHCWGWCKERLVGRAESDFFNVIKVSRQRSPSFFRVTTFSSFSGVGNDH